MSRHRMRELAHVAAIAFSFTFIFAIVALAQDRRQGEPGQFDFYVLALSWSPSYCEAAQARAPARAPDQQCGGRPFAFVVHGLWPQYERGFPSYCQVPAPRLDRAVVGSMLDLMPSPRLIFHEWDQHGTCSGLSAHSYFDTVRKARAVVKIPPDYLELGKPITVSPGEVTEAFVKANPGFHARRSPFLAITGASRKCVYVLAKIFHFTTVLKSRVALAELGKIAMPAVRGR